MSFLRFTELRFPYVVLMLFNAFFNIDTLSNVTTSSDFIKEPITKLNLYRSVNFFVQNEMRLRVHRPKEEKYTLRHVLDTTQLTTNMLS